MAIPKPSQWPTAYAKIQRLSDREVLLVLRQASADVNKMLRTVAAKRGIGALVRQEQLLTIRRSLLREQAQIFRKLGNIIRARRLEAAAKAIQLGSAIDTALLEAAGRTGQARALRIAATQGLEQTIETVVARMTQSRLPLSERIYRTQLWMDGRIDRLINSALTRGLSAREFAREAQDWFDPNVPGGTRYASLRLARTEINNAFHAASVAHAEEKPWIEGMKWHLSRSHPKPDVCDSLAHGGSKGDGVYRPRDVPRKPHPHCFCYVTPVSPGEDEFLDNLLGGQFDDFLAAKAR